MGSIYISRSRSTAAADPQSKTTAAESAASVLSALRIVYSQVAPVWTHKYP